MEKKIKLRIFIRLPLLRCVFL